MLKIFRKVSAGEHPEAEMGRYLTAQGFPNTPALLGEVVRITTTASDTRWRSRRRSCATRATPGAGRSTASTARSTISRRREGGAEARADEVADYRRSPPRSASGSARCMPCWRGRRTIRPLRRRPQAPGRRSWASARVRAARARLRAAEAAGDVGQRNGRGAGEAPAVAAGAADARAEAPGQAGVGTAMTRIHGDFHLGQVLVASGDVYIIDFEGEPAGRSRSAAPRRARCATSPACCARSTMRPPRRSIRRT